MQSTGDGTFFGVVAECGERSTLTISEHLSINLFDMQILDSAVGFDARGEGHRKSIDARQVEVGD